MNPAPWEYLFVCSGRPFPRSIDKFQKILSKTTNAAMIYLERKRDGDEAHQLNIDHIGGGSIIAYDVSFRSVGPKRLFSLLSLVFFVFFKIRPRCIRASTKSRLQIYCNSIDILFAFRIAMIGKPCTYRLEIADLNSIQLDRGVIPSLWRLIERVIIQCVDMLVLTCEEYHTAYYAKIYDGKRTVIENWPDPKVWDGFRRAPRQDEFLIGYIGALRYLDCLYALIDAVALLRAKGIAINIRFAGGGEVEPVRRYCTIKGVPAEITGPFTYSSQVQELYRDIHVSYSVYDTKYMNVRCAMPNKFYESFFTGIPIMVASGTYLARRVEDAGIGTGVDCKSPEQIASALELAVAGTGWYAQSLRHLATCNFSVNSDKDIESALFD